MQGDYAVMAFGFVLVVIVVLSLTPLNGNFVLISIIFLAYSYWLQHFFNKHLKDK